jgi:nephrocystin-3
MSSNKRRVVRVFISSTFVDFQEERRLLVERVFPALNRKAWERGVELVPVDLRWGVTAEQADRGETLPICLGEIERCRPYFIGLLGERYGWVPPADHYRPELLARQPWLQSHIAGSSVTELEILHGVLNNPEMAGQAFFYIRESSWSLGQQGPGFICTTRQEVRKLKSLKARIKSSGFPVVDEVPNPQAIAERIEADLWALIEEQFPDEQSSDLLATHARQHAQYRADRIGLYLGGEDYIAQLNQWFSSGEQRILISGESGSGKSALIANWMEAHGQVYPEDRIYTHHLGSTNDASALRPMLARMLETVSRQLAEELAEPIQAPPDWWDLVATVGSTLALLSAWCKRHSCRWIWVLDGLDKLEQGDQLALPWLPTHLPEGIHVVASALECPARTILQERNYPNLTIGPVGEQERELLIQQYLGKFTKGLESDLQARISAHPAGGSPLFLRILLEELRLSATYETLPGKVSHYLKAKGIDELYGLVLKRLEADGHRGTLAKALSALWACRTGLCETDLLEITGLLPVQWAPVGIALQEALSESANRITFGNTYLRNAVEARYLKTEARRRQEHKKLADWLEANEEVDDVAFVKFKAEEWPWQLQQAGRLEDLRQYLLDAGFLAYLQCWRPCAEIIEYWRICKRETDANLDELIAASVVQEINRIREEPDHLIYFINSIASLLLEAGLHGELLLRLRQLSLELEESGIGYDELSVSQSLKWLADAHLLLCQYTKAESLYQRCLEANELLPEADHLATANILNNLGRIYADTGRYLEAEVLLKRSADISNQLLGAEHPLTLTTLDNLAGVYLDLGDYDRAETLFSKCLEARKLALGNDHPFTLITINNISALYYLKDDHERAEIILLGSRETMERLLESGHPAAIHPMLLLAAVWSFQGQYEQAEAVCMRLLKTTDKMYGQNNPYTLDVDNTLGNIYRAMGKYEQAEACYLRCLKGREELLGPGNPSTLTALNNLTGLYDEIENHGHAEKVGKFD